MPSGGQGQSLESVRAGCHERRYEIFAIQVSQTDEDRINPDCVKLGLATVVDTELLDWREKTTKSGMIWQIVSVKVTVTIIDSDSGEFLQT